MAIKIVAADEYVKNTGMVKYHATTEVIADIARKKYITVKCVYLNTSTFIIL
jgi:hypothetical protein